MTAGRGVWGGWVEVYRYRSCWANLIGLDQKLRYKNTLVGFLWSFLNPLLLMAVFVVVFGHVGRFSESIQSYPIFLLTGLLPWQFFTSSLLGASLSFRGAPDLVTKVAFPRQIIPLASVSTNLINFLYSLVVLLGFYVFSDTPMGPTLLYVPLIIFFQFLLQAGAGYIFAVASVFYHDVHYLLGIVLGMAFYLTPIFYPVAMVPDPYVPWLNLNPMTHFITAYHRVMLYGVAPGPKTFLFVAASGLIMYAVGWELFRKYQSRIAEVL